MHHHHAVEFGGEDDPPGGPGPSGCAPLSWQENEVLDEIEHDLASSDPGLFVRMSRLDDLDPLPRWARMCAGLAFGVILMIFVIALPMIAGLVLMGLVAAAVFLPAVFSPPGGHIDPEART